MTVGSQQLDPWSEAGSARQFRNQQREAVSGSSGKTPEIDVSQPDRTVLIHGIRESTTALDLLQAVTEATYHRIERIVGMLGEDGRGTPKLIVSGSAVKSASSLERLANVLGRAIYPNGEPDPSMRGAAVFALEKLGYPIPEHKLINPVKPRKAAAREYAEARERQRRIEELL